MVLFCSVWLFAEEEPSGDKWDIEDYKRAIESRYKGFEIHEFEEFATYETGEKYFLGRDSDGSSYLFSFNKQLEFRDFSFLGEPVDEHILEILTNSLSGVRIWNSPAVIRDFKNDGHNEIAFMLLGGSAYSFWILGIDPDIKEIVYYFNGIFYVDYPPTFAPVEFMKYKGMDGFKMLRIVPPPERASVKYPFRGNKSISWFFYTWDKEEKKYVIVEEFEEDWEKSYKEPVQSVLAEHNTDETPVFTESDSGNSRFIFYIGIAVGVIALSFALFFVVRRKKG